MDLLRQGLVQFSGLPKEKIECITSLFQIANVPARHLLLSSGEKCQTAWFIGTGVLRAFYRIEEKKRAVYITGDEKNLREITNWIVPAGGFLTDISSFLHKRQAIYNIEAIEPSKVYSLSYSNYQKIQRSHPEIAQLLFEHTLAMADSRVRMCNIRNPEERLEMFEDLYPLLKGRLSVNIQASYLNIDPATLSRIRSKTK